MLCANEILVFHSVYSREYKPLWKVIYTCMRFAIRHTHTHTHRFCVVFAILSVNLMAKLPIFADLPIRPKKEKWKRIEMLLRLLLRIYRFCAVIYCSIFHAIQSYWVHLDFIYVFYLFFFNVITHTHTRAPYRNHLWSIHIVASSRAHRISHRKCETMYSHSWHAKSKRAMAAEMQQLHEPVSHTLPWISLFIYIYFNIGYIIVVVISCAMLTNARARINNSQRIAPAMPPQ